MNTNSEIAAQYAAGSGPRQYTKQYQKLLSGSLNLMPPGDVIAPPDALVLRNWRPWKDGALWSRLGNSAPILNVSGNINSIFEFLAARVTGDTPLTFVGDDSGTLHEIGGHNMVVTGFAGTGGLGSASEWPISIAAMNGVVYAFTQAQQKRIGFMAPFGGAAAATAPMEFLPPTPSGGSVAFSAPPGGDGASDFGAGDTIDYWITFTFTDGTEGDGEEITATCPTAGYWATITLPTTTDSLVTGVNVYRQNDELDQPYLVGSNVPGGTFSDNGAGDKSDDAIAAAGVNYNTNAQGPPPAAGVGGPWMGHMFCWNSAQFPSRFWWSLSGDGNVWPGASLDDGNWADTGGDLDPIVDMSFFPELALIYRTNSIWRLIGDPDDDYSVLEPLVSGVGMVGPKARCRAGQIDYFAAAQGIFACDGDSVRMVSRKIQNLFDGDANEVAGTMPPMPIPSLRYGTCMGHRLGRIYTSYNDGTAS